MRHFILTFDPESAENALTKINNRIDSVMEKVEDVHNNLTDISNYVTKLVLVRNTQHLEYPAAGMPNVWNTQL